MTSVLPLLLLAGVTFSGEEIPGLSVGEVNRLNGRVSVDFRQADLDGDGAVDLVLRSEVLFQREGQFPPNARAALPAFDKTPLTCDVWRDMIYFRTTGGLKAIRWLDGKWGTALDLAVAWPRSAPQYETESAKPGFTRFQGFLHDLNADGAPEVVLPAADGLHVYAIDAAGCTPAATLDVLPPPGFELARGQSLWPPERRSVVFPSRQMRCRLSLTGPVVTVVTSEDVPEACVRYTLTRYTLDPANEFAILPEATQRQVVGPLPICMEPCRLNNDAQMDFAGGDWETTKASVIAAPIYQTLVSLDGGRTRHAERAQFFTPHCSFVDFDGDGDLDLVTETTGLFEGGIRETVTRFLSGRDVNHTVGVHFQDARGRFSETPDVTGVVSIHFDRAFWQGGLMLDRYLAAELCNITGDFDGNGYRDLVVQHEPGRLAVYLCKGRGFSSRPDAVLSMARDARFAVADVNGDGQSDVVVSWTSALEGDETETKSRVYFAREDN